MHMIGHDDIAANCPAKPSGGLAPFLAPFFDQNVGSLRMGQNTPPPVGACGQKIDGRLDPDTIKSLQMFMHRHL